MNYKGRSFYKLNKVFSYLFKEWLIFEWFKRDTMNFKCFFIDWSLWILVAMKMLIWFNSIIYKNSTYFNYPMILFILKSSCFSIENDIFFCHTLNAIYTLVCLHICDFIFLMPWVAFNPNPFYILHRPVFIQLYP